MSFANATKTWGDVASNIRRLFGDESGVQLEEGDIHRWINQGQYEIARHNKILKAKGTQMTVPNEASYELDLGREVQQIESIRFNGERLIPTEFTTIDANYREYPPDASGEPRLWYKWGSEITLWPAPKTASKLEIFFTASPKTHSSYDASRLLEIPDNYFLPLVDFILGKAHEMDDNTESQALSVQAYTERINAMNDEERTGQSLTFSSITMVD